MTGDPKGAALALAQRLGSVPPEERVTLLAELLNNVCINCGHVDLPPTGSCPTCGHPEGERLRAARQADIIAVGSLKKAVFLTAPPPSECHGGCGAVIVGRFCVECAESIEARQKLAERRPIVRAALALLPEYQRVMAFGDTIDERRRKAGLLPVEDYVADKRVVLHVREILKKPLPLFIVLHGASQKGKTSLACAIARWAIEKALLLGATDAEVNTAAEFFFTTAYHPAKARAETPLGRGEAPIVDRCIRAPLLVLDEMANEPARSSAMTEIIVERAAARRTTIVTLKKNEVQLAEVYRNFDAESIVSRVYAKSSAILSFDGVKV